MSLMITDHAARIPSELQSTSASVVLQSVGLAVEGDVGLPETADFVDRAIHGTVCLEFRAGDDTSVSFDMEVSETHRALDGVPNLPSKMRRVKFSVHTDSLPLLAQLLQTAVREAFARELPAKVHTPQSVQMVAMM